MRQSRSKFIILSNIEQVSGQQSGFYEIFAWELGADAGVQMLEAPKTGGPGKN